MKHAAQIRQDASTSELFRAIFLAAIIIVKRFAVLIGRAMKAARRWLITPRNYFAFDGEPIRATGLQVVAAQIVLAFFGVLLSIRW